LSGLHIIEALDLSVPALTAFIKPNGCGKKASTHDMTTQIIHSFAYAAAAMEQCFDLMVYNSIVTG
jgi:hypothetical protein